MSELQRRLTRLEIEDANDRQEIVHAQARIDAREAVIRLLRAQILINKSLEDGSLPTKPFCRLRKDVASRGVDAMKCQACISRPDDALLSRCGHLYCAQCLGEVQSGYRERRSCGRKLKNEVDVDSTLFDAMCTQFRVSFADVNDTSTTTSDEENLLPIPRSSRGCVGLAQYQNTLSIQPGSDVSHIAGILLGGSASEDDGFENRSQRSRGYGDDGNSFVSEDESVDMNANFEVDDGTQDEEDLSTDLE